MTLKNLRPSFVDVQVLFENLMINGFILALYVTKYSRTEQVELGEDNF